MVRHRLPVMGAAHGAIAICFAAGVAANAPLAAQESRLVLAESGRRVLSAEVVVRGGALSPGGGRRPVLERRHGMARLFR